MNDLEKLEELLSEVQKCVDKDTQIKREQFQRGECFNVFDVLNLRTSETRTHSAFLAELLNPEGSHGCGSELLKIFLEKCGIPDFSEEDLRKAKVTTEYYIGPVDEDKKEGGRIDILIQVKNWTVVIENKIKFVGQPGDQPNQILRYYKFASTKPPFKIFYLTLDGHEASPDSAGKLKAGKDYFLMSYKRDILDFIQKSELAAIRKPLVRETLIQYENLIKKLTKQDMDTQQEQKVFETVAKYAEAFVKIKDEIDEVLLTQWAHKKYVRTKLEQFAKENGLVYKDDYGNLWNKWNKKEENGFYFYKPEWKISAIFIIKEQGSDKYYSGISSRPEESLKELKKLNKQENRLSIYKEQNECWPLGWGYIREPFAWGAPYVVPGMVNGDFVKYVEYLVLKILGEIKELEKKGIKLP